MPRLSMTQIASYAREAGIKDSASLATAVAIAMAESGGNTDAVGDVSLQNATWGPSIGLWQIRSLKAEKGRGTTRDETRLRDPAYNARAMFNISSGGRNWTPWTVYTRKTYTAYLLQAKAAVAGSNNGLAPAVDVDIPLVPDKEIQGAKKLWDFLSDANNWIRTGLILAGFILLWIGILVMTQNTKVMQAARQVAISAGKKAVTKGKL